MLIHKRITSAIKKHLVRFKRRKRVGGKQPRTTTNLSRSIITIHLPDGVSHISVHRNDRITVDAECTANSAPILIQALRQAAWIVTRFDKTVEAIEEEQV